MKSNVDGVVFFDQNKVGIGFILRNAQGETIMAACLPEEGIKTPKEVELAAILRGLQICIELEIKKIILKSDCLFILQECLSVNSHISKIDSVVTDIKELQTKNDDYQLQHVF